MNMSPYYHIMVNKDSMRSKFLEMGHKADRAVRNAVLLAVWIEVHDISLVIKSNLEN